MKPLKFIDLVVLYKRLLSFYELFKGTEKSRRIKQKTNSFELSKSQPNMAKVNIQDTVGRRILYKKRL